MTLSLTLSPTDFPCTVVLSFTCFWFEPISCLALHANLLSSWPFQKSLDGDDQLAQEALDDWPALGKLILHLNLQHISYQSHKCIFLKKE